MTQQFIFFLFAQSGTDDTTSSWLSTIAKGGPVGYIIICLSLVALAVVVMHFLQIRRTALLPQDQLVLLE